MSDLDKSARYIDCCPTAFCDSFSIFNLFKRRIPTIHLLVIKQLASGLQIFPTASYFCASLPHPLHKQSYRLLGLPVVLVLFPSTLTSSVC